ncbi:larval cuticle protein A1A [Galendromus occidentalis]|uniref:Larval cuticle protein A1A n=1 Tax=Galendromus occidentalis TaxID=34638 RepID=A0AAJ6QWX7_9ACAR|nr:larval cuticle protein A1A [Galendromus occidentalis]
MFAKIVAVAVFVAAAHAGHLYSAPLLAAPIKYAPIASSYQYETRIHSAPIITKYAAPLAYAAPIHKFAAPLAYAAPALSVTHHGYAHAPLFAPKFAAPVHYGAPIW